MNWKISIPIAVVVVAILGVMFMGGKGTPAPAVVKDTSAPVTQGEVVQGGVTVTPVTQVSGNVDDLTLQLSSAADADLSTLSDPAGDKTTVTSDSQSINGLASAYDETTF